MATPQFLRLDEVKQLGFIHKIWPGAKHTRFEHSLGVANLVRGALDHLRAAPGEGGLPPLTGVDRRTLVAAALLHDVGHYPFSHCIEELGPPIAPHEAIGRRLIESTSLVEVLERDWGVSPARVANLIAPTEPLAGIDALLVQLLSGALDMDKLDYLPRDAKACNVPYGRVDTPRRLMALRVRSVDGRPRIVVTDQGVSPLHSLINARQEMFDNVYWHHTNRACMVMLLRAVQEALLAGAVTPEGLTDHTDASLLALLAGPTMPAATRDLVERLGRRRLHKRGLEISARAGRPLPRPDASLRRARPAPSAGGAPRRPPDRVVGHAGRRPRPPDRHPEAGEVVDRCLGLVPPPAARLRAADALDGGGRPRAAPAPALRGASAPHPPGRRRAVAAARGGAPRCLGRRASPASMMRDA
jgi:HD superfamily phosphohydrolase